MYSKNGNVHLKMFQHEPFILNVSVVRTICRES